MTETITCSMLIVAVPEAVFRALTDPAQLCEFWLDKASGSLAQGATVEWHFKVPGAQEAVTVTEFDCPHRLGFTWSDNIAVRFQQIRHGEGQTVAQVTATGFPDAASAVNAAEGFTLVLSDLKLYLETGRSPGLVAAKAALITDRTRQHSTD